MYEGKKKPPTLIKVARLAGAVLCVVTAAIHLIEGNDYLPWLIMCFVIMIADDLDDLKKKG